MNGTTPVFLTCTEIRRRLRTHFLIQSEVPTEHAISFPLPTRRSGNPGYALFASPAFRLAGRPMEQGAPDRWWVLNAYSGHLEIYALWSVIHFADATWASQVVHPPFPSVAGMREALSKIETGLNTFSPIFFSGGVVSQSDRFALKQSLESVLAAEILPQYRGLVPDFWAWLESP